ncbi:uncharacterized protein [Temnothorax longispinosus]|uniref:uncharacterized protein n=1 Tax=Temnothorax longispinosus TaxID=300112 RepID=UPI003A9902F6
MITDIEKMYRQIIVHPEDRDHQRILWRSAVEQLVRVLRLTTVTYGLKCSPWVAIRTLLQLAKDKGARFPHGAIALEDDRYVDDVVTGEDTIDDAVEVQPELRELCTAGGRVSVTQVGRELRGRSRWLTPVVIRAKILIQSTWLKGLEWDAPLPATDAQQWESFLGELPRLELVRATRWLDSGADSRVEIHGFADASERDYAAAVYLRVTRNGSTTLHLLTAKSKRTLPEALWRHVPGRDNPADCASRGIAPSELIGHPLWWAGPPWLREDQTQWPAEDDEIPDAEIAERKAVVQSAVGKIDTEPDTLLRFSALHRLLRVTAWCLRWRCDTSRTTDHDPDDQAQALTPGELDAALFR